MRERVDIALQGYLLICAGVGAWFGSFAWPFPVTGFFVPGLFRSALIMGSAGALMIWWAGR